MTENPSSGGMPRFAIFRAQDAKSEAEAPIMRYEPMSPVSADGVQRVTEAGWGHGHDLKVLFATPGFSLVRVWFKSSFPLPRHAHDCACLYYIVGGSLRIGDRELGVGDGFFIDAGAPYSYVPGPAGVEVLEFRATDAFNIEVMADGRRFWDKAVETVRQQQSAWAGETPPSRPRPG